MSPQAKIGILTVIFIALTVALLVFSTLKQAQVSCEACVTFHGRTQCRTAAGPDRDQAVRTAIDNACGLLASGMADSISCTNTPPDRVSCEE